MLSLLKVFGRGVLVTISLPLIVLIWALYSVYCIGLFVYMFVKSVIDYFRGKDFNGDLVEDLESRKIVLEQEKADDQAKQMLNIMYQNTMNQHQYNQFEQQDSQKESDEQGISSSLDEPNEEPNIEGDNDDLRGY